MVFDAAYLLPYSIRVSLRDETVNCIPKEFSMPYSFNKIMSCSYTDAIMRVTEALKNEGFGVLTEIDVQKTLKKKLDPV